LIIKVDCGKIDHLKYWYIILYITSYTYPHRLIFMFGDDKRV